MPSPDTSQADENVSVAALSDWFNADLRKHPNAELPPADKVEQSFDAVSQLTREDVLTEGDFQMLLERSNQLMHAKRILEQLRSLLCDNEEANRTFDEIFAGQTFTAKELQNRFLRHSDALKSAEIVSRGAGRNSQYVRLVIKRLFEKDASKDLTAQPEKETGV